MARPTHVSINHGLEGWDGEVDDNFDLIFETPLPLGIYANFAALPAAGSYNECIAVISDEDVICISNGSAWIRIGVKPPAYANFAGLPAAASHLDELAVIQDLDVLCISDGTNWKIIGTQGVTVAAMATSSITMPADAPATADALRDDLVANALAEIATALTDHETQFNALRTSLRNSDVVA